MRIIEPANPVERDNNRLNRLYYLKQQQLQRAAGSQADSLLYKVLAAEADAISTAMTRETTDVA